MNRIVGIIDMDGFTIAKKFYCKELGVLQIGNDEGSSYHFNLGINWQDLSVKDRQQCKFNRKKYINYPSKIPKASLSLI